jgi:hypothetical protein
LGDQSNWAGACPNISEERAESHFGAVRRINASNNQVEQERWGRGIKYEGKGKYVDNQALGSDPMPKSLHVPHTGAVASPKMSSIISRLI